MTTDTHPEGIDLRVEEIPLRFGYTMADLEQMTRAAVMADRSGALPFESRRAAAWEGIAIALYAAPYPAAAARHLLITEGWKAIYREVRDGRRHLGDRDGTGHHGSRFAKYWWNPPTQFDEHLIERIATHQILATLGGIYREAVIALAVHGTPKAAAAALGLEYGTFNMRLAKARRDFTRRWHEHETPRKAGRAAANGGLTCARGHPRAEHGRINNQGKWHCNLCARIRDTTAKRKYGWTRMAPK
jgi:hypothetical protein